MGLRLGLHVYSKFQPRKELKYFIILYKANNAPPVFLPKRQIISYLKLIVGFFHVEQNYLTENNIDVDTAFIEDA